MIRHVTNWFVICLVSVAIAWSCAARSEADPLQGKKLIEWGWDEPDTKFIRQNIARMEALPFDGLVFHVNSSKGGGLTWEMWGSRRFNLDEFKQAIDDLTATKFRRFTDPFLRVNVTPGKVAWFDEQAWSAVLNNFGVAAQVAKQGRCRGFMFDVEQYDGQLFDYRQQKQKNAKPFADYQAKVRQRGKEWMREVNRHFPDITILLTFGYSITQPKGRAKDRSEVRYGLLADFLDGMLDACSQETAIVDAWESSYSYKAQKQFEQAHQTIKEKALGWTAVPEKYKDHVKAGFGIWMDNNWRRKGWDLKDFSKNYFSPGECENAVRSALHISDEYVWIYTEQARWWTNEKLPQAYVDAVANARKGVSRSAQADGKDRPLVKNLGTIDLLMVETTPVVFNDRLYRFEYVRDNYGDNKTGASYFRFIDVATGKATPAFAKGTHLGCAFVEGDSVYAFGVDKWGGSKITVFHSHDLKEWQSQTALTLPGWGLFNTSVCKAGHRYVMAIEVGEPKEVVGVPFTIFFAESKDLLTWKLLPQECVYSKEKYTACPALRYLDGYFYMIYLEARPGPTYESHVVRSKDLRHWESSRLNPVLSFSEDDKRIANPKLTPDQRKAIAQAKDINNSDVDLCEFQGKTIIYYSWGNQQGNEFLAEAVYEGTLASFLRGWFPEQRQRERP
jgi:hypothetical protein